MNEESQNLFTDDCEKCDETLFHYEQDQQDNSKDEIDRVKKASFICITFMTIGGLMANSLAILSDAAHMVFLLIQGTDQLGLFIQLFVIYLSKKRQTERLSYGYHRIDVLGAIFGVFLIWIMTAVLLNEAIERFEHPETVDGLFMMIVAVAGLISNLVMLKVLGGHGHSHGGHQHEGHDSKVQQQKETHGHSHGHKESIEQVEESNQDSNKQKQGSLAYQSAILHVLGDLLQSVGVVIASIIIFFYPSATIADPICTFIFGFIILGTTIPLFLNGLYILMESTPKDFKIKQFKKELEEIKSVEAVHDVHVWSIKPGKICMTAHIKCQNIDYTLNKATKICRKYQIYHSTIQSESTNNIDKCQQNIHL